MLLAPFEASPPLDTNSSYCNLLQSSHFSSTSVAAELPGEANGLVGFISGYIIPERADTLFVWQVAVADRARGQGLASRMLAHILARPQCKSVSCIETSITESNQASWALFKRMSENLSTELQSSDWMDSQLHFSGLHDTEYLVKLGPFKNIYALRDPADGDGQ